MGTIQIKRSVPSHFREVSGKNLPALLDATQKVMDHLQDVVEQCMDQLFIPTASGKYLINLGEDKGFTLPKNSGLDIRAYRQLVPIMVSAPKQVRVTIEELVEAFYGSDRVRPSISSSVQGPYQLISGDDLTIETESGTVTVSITTGLVSDLNSVTAGEIAAVLNSSQQAFLATTGLDRTTGGTYIKILSRSVGAGAKIRVSGGTLQNVLQFPKVVPTTITGSTTFLITKTSDLIKFTWNGLGLSPELYLARAGDLLTIRGLVQVGPDAFQNLNGSYEIADVGYDYVAIRNTKFTSLSATLAVPGDTSFVITSQEPVTLFDQEERATVTEIGTNQLTVTVPAVPPLARRFLAGSAHLHGAEMQVLDFTRTTMTFELPTGTDRPLAGFQFLTSWDASRYDARRLRGLAVSVDQSPTPTATIEASDEAYQPFPFTANTALGVNGPISGTPGSDLLEVSFDYPHGLFAGWGMTLAGATTTGNLSSGQINKEHIVYRVLDPWTVVIRPKSAGLTVNFSGVTFGSSDLYRHATVQPDDSDVYLEFLNPAAVVASGLAVGQRVRLDATSGIDIVPALASVLKSINLEVISISGNTVNLKAAVGVGPEGLIIDNVSGFRQGSFGGNAVTYRFDKTSTHNQQILESMKFVNLTYQPSSNDLYVGSFLYDETGQVSTLQVGRQIVRLTQGVLRGENPTGLLVDGTDFPQSGNLVMEFGTSRREGPIRFFALIANPGATQILLDPAYRFKTTHPIGAEVQVVTALTPHASNGDGSDYPIYLTGTTAARNTMFDLIETLVAAGIFVNRDVLLPDLRYVDTSIGPFE
jgi:hypothetical protein